MYEKELVKDAGLTDGEAKVYLTLLELGSSTTGPVIDRSGVARSFIYNILEKLIEKGLVSYVAKDNKKIYQASDPEKILDYIEKRKQSLDESKEKMKKLLPGLSKIRETNPSTEIQVYEGFRGLQTAFEHYHNRLFKGDEMMALGVFPYQEERYHGYWQQDHIIRGQKGIRNKLLFNRGTPREVLENRNSYKLADARYMESDMKTPAWINIYKNVTQIYLQDKKKPIVVEIINEQIAQTFKAYFDEFWKKSKPFK